MPRKILFLVSILSLLGLAARAEPLAVGAAAPAVTAPDQDGRPVDLGHELQHGLTLVYFYPKAGTSGCTAQACSLRDAITDLKNLGVRVIGVSHDTPAAQKKFAEKYALPFTLLADHEGKVIQAFGVPTIVFGISMRQSFLFRDGRVIWRSLSAQTKEHAAEVEKALASLPRG